MPTTLSPAFASGRTATPPAAPRPITTTSAGLRLMAIVLAPRRSAIRLGGDAHPLVFRSHGQARARILDQVPTGKILVAAVMRISKHSFQHQPPRAIEKSAQNRKIRRLAFFDLADHQVPLLLG